MRLGSRLRSRLKRCLYQVTDVALGAAKAIHDRVEYVRGFADGDYKGRR